MRSTKGGPTANSRQTDAGGHVSAVRLVKNPVPNALQSRPRSPARYIPTASPVLCQGPVSVLDVKNAKHQGGPTANSRQSGGGEHVSAVHSKVDPLGVALAIRDRASSLLAAMAVMPRLVPATNASAAALPAEPAHLTKPLGGTKHAPARPFWLRVWRSIARALALGVELRKCAFYQAAPVLFKAVPPVPNHGLWSGIGINQPRQQLRLEEWPLTPHHQTRQV